jgi:hypothetical protein
VAAADPTEKAPPFFAGTVGHVTAKSDGLPSLSPGEPRGLYRLVRNATPTWWDSTQSPQKLRAAMSTSAQIATTAIAALA